MGNVLFKELSIAKQKTTYDEYVKRILGNRIILAWILKYTTEEFRDCSVDEIAEDYIIDGVEISESSIIPGQKKNRRIVGQNTEDKVPEEGIVTFDIRFQAIAPEKSRYIKLLINVEAQKDFYPGYEIVTRGIFYGARMISSQLDTEFSGSDYNDVKKVYSIWICMNGPKFIGNAIAEYSIKKRDVVGSFPDKRSSYDKMTVILLCLFGEMKDSDNAILQLLSVLLSSEIELEQKKKILDKEYGIRDEMLGKELDNMCNLSELVWERAMEKGIEQGIEQGIELKLRELIAKKKAKGK